MYFVMMLLCIHYLVKNNNKAIKSTDLVINDFIY